MLQVSIICTDPRHPVNASLTAWAQEQTQGGTANVQIVRDFRELTGGDFLFLVSCHQMIRKPTRDRFRYTLVLHASALPDGRGMSPHIWQIVEGKSVIMVTLLNAEDLLDSGSIWHQLAVHFDGTELFDEINVKIFEAEMRLLTWAISNCDSSTPYPQRGEGSFYRKRVPADSAIDPQRSIAESFDLLRVADPDRYPAHFEYRGQRYRIRLEKM